MIWFLLYLIIGTCLGYYFGKGIKEVLWVGSLWPIVVIYILVVLIQFFVRFRR